MATFDPYRKWLGIPPEEQPPNHYRLLGIGLFETDPDVISNAADRQMVHVRTYQSGKHSDLSQKILNELAAARVCLLDPARRDAYDQLLRGLLGLGRTAGSRPTLPVPPPPGSPPPPPGISKPPVATGNLPPPPASEPLLASPPAPAPFVSSYSGRRKKSSLTVPLIATTLLVLAAVAVIAVALNRAGSADRKTNGDTSSAKGQLERSDVEPVSRPAKTSSAVRGKTVPPKLLFPNLNGLQDPVGEIRGFKGHTAPATAAAMSPDGAQILSGSEDGTVRLWDVETGDELRRLAGPNGPVLSATFCPIGKHMAASSGTLTPPADGVVHVWPVVEVQKKARKADPKPDTDNRPVAINIAKAGVAWDVRFSTDGKLLVLACQDGSVRIVDAATGTESQRFTGHRGPVRSAVLSPDGKQAVSGGDDGVVRVWKTADAVEIRPLKGHEGSIRCVAISPSGKHALSGGDDQLVRLWDLEDGAELGQYKGHTGPVTSVAFSPDGSRAMSGSLDGTLRLWRLRDVTESRNFAAHTGGVRSVAYSGNGRRAVSAGNDNLVRLWGLPDYGVHSEGPLVPDKRDPSKPLAEKRLPVPDVAALTKAETAVVGGPLKPDFEAPERPGVKSALAQKLLDEAAKTAADPATAFVLLRLARDRAAAAGETDAALAAVEETGKRFEVNVLELKAETLAALAAGKMPVEPRKLLGTQILAAGEEALAADEFALAEQVLTLAQSQFRLAHENSLAKQAAARVVFAKQQMEAYAPIQRARDVLAAKPDDPQANLTVGKHYCLVKGDWSRGLPFLARAADAEPALSKLARTDLAGPKLPADRLALADGWWNAAEKLGPDAQEQLRRHAAKSYKAVVADLTGDEQKRVQERLDEVGDPSAPAESGLLPAVSGLECRGSAGKLALLKTFGGNPASEAAVERALEWLDHHQRIGGSWSFNHATSACKTSCPDPGMLGDQGTNAATALALLPFLAAGNSQRSGKYAKTVAGGVGYLRSRMVATAAGGTLYERLTPPLPSHAWGTMAMCEACAASRDGPTAKAALAAIRFIVASQNADGGWGAKLKIVEPTPDASDLNSTAWMLLALKSAQLSGFSVSDRPLKEAEKFLGKLVADDTSGYHNTAAAKGAVDPTATAAAMLLRIQMGWPREQPELAAYVERAGKAGPALNGRLALGLFNAQVLRDAGGPAWEPWQAALRDNLLATQQTEAHGAGSWFFNTADWGNKPGGRLFCTAMSALILEVYYRYPPVYK